MSDEIEMTAEMKPRSCLVIGAGLAGLVAARELKRHNFKVTVLDKGRAVGGRLATRRIDEAVFDHGAQFFTVRDDDFKKLADEWLSLDVAREWSRGWADANGVYQADGHPRYRGTRGMTGIAKFMAIDLDVRTNTQVSRITTNEDGWHVETTTGESFASHMLVLTPPAPQSIKLLQAGDVELPEEARAALEKIAYNPCLCVMATLDEGCRVPEPGAIQIKDGEPIYWIADNTRKGIASSFDGACAAVTIHAGAEWSRANYDAPDDYVGDELLREAGKILGTPLRARMSNVKRWRYSQPAILHHEPCLFVEGERPLVFAGDAFGGAKVEGAALSGLAASRKLIEACR